MVLQRHINTLEREAFDLNSKNQVAKRVINTTRNVNALAQENTSVGTDSVALTFPAGAINFIVFHQHATAKVYFGDVDVEASTSYPYLENGDTLALDVKDTIDLYAISDTAGVTVFVIGEVKE
jgi:hypothetical protein